MDCSCFEKIEAALERILGSPDFSYLKWVPKNGFIEAVFNGTRESPYVQGASQPCDLPAAIMELRDRLDPPIQKERQWRVGDELNDTRDARWVIVAPDERGWKVIRIGDGSKREIRDGKVWSNLTIEAEQAGEK